MTHVDDKRVAAVVDAVAPVVLVFEADIECHHVSLLMYVDEADDSWRTLAHEPVGVVCHAVERHLEHLRLDLGDTAVGHAARQIHQQTVA